MQIFKPKYKNKEGEYVTSTNWAVVIRENGKRHVKSLQTSNKTLAISRAKAIISAMEEKSWATVSPILPGTQKKGVQIAELIAEYENFAGKKGLAPLTMQQNVNALKRFARAISADYVHELSVDAFLQTEYAKKLKSQSRAANMRQIMSIFSKDALAYYRSKGFVVEAPEAQRVFWRAKPVAPFIAPSREDVLKLMRSAESAFLPQKSGMWLLFMLALQAGLRQGEAIHLKWADVREDGLIIRSDEMHRTKSGRTRFVPVAEIVLEQIGKHRKGDDDYVVCGDRQRTAKALAPWLREHGINDRKPLHYLRKLYGSLVATEHGLYTAKEYLGHSSVTVTESYYADLLHKKTVQWGT